VKKFFGSIFGILVIVFVAVIVAVGLRYGNLKFEQFFAPKEQSIQREVFENTKSYVHGAIQDIAKYYDEYNKAKDDQEKEVIKNVIKQRFAEFDANNIKSFQLRQWFINIRGY